MLQQLTEEQLLQVMEGVPTVDYPNDKLTNGIDIVSFLAETSIFPSKGEARKMVQGGGVSINKMKKDDAALAINNSFLMNQKYMLVQKGKKNYYLVIVS